MPESSASRIRVDRAACRFLRTPTGNQRELHNSFYGKSRLFAKVFS